MRDEIILQCNHSLNHSLQNKIFIFVFSISVIFTVASWKYDKRILNDAPFVYFCTELVSDEERENNINRNSENADKMQSIYAYAKRVLDALDVKWGPTHLGGITHTLLQLQLQP